MKGEIQTRTMISSSNVAGELRQGQQQRRLAGCHSVCADCRSSVQEEQGRATAGKSSDTSTSLPPFTRRLMAPCPCSLIPPPLVRSDFWVSKDTTFHGKAIIRCGVTTPKLTANTCSCALDRYYSKAAGTTGTR